jgi:hypothetical protein
MDSIIFKYNDSSEIAGKAVLPFSLQKVSLKFMEKTIRRKNAKIWLRQDFRD